ncbi:RNA helicase required for poly(A+) mRNA export [Endocarpon pusillum]|uniref:RNA helicase n=1 Tax=Endocarpon pusillum TaxID=364733 RepID=A0A8H7AMA9_9EURO|nr:RNA helicase required for poly(A+) mRNA export [Endocarpon pusillum]
MASGEQNTASNGNTLADRISKPDPPVANDWSATATPFQPKSGKLWSEETDSPISPLAESSLPLEGTAKSSTETPPAEPSKPPNMPQSDGATTPLNGSVLEEPEFSVQVKLADLQADPNNPLYSVSTFEQLNLKSEILKGIYSMNFRKPSKVQEKTLPLLMMNPPRNLIGQSQSGTGKTAAFTLNILSRLELDTPQQAATPQAIVLAPTRELARQIKGVIMVMGSFLPNLNVELAVPVDTASRGRKMEGSVVVGTPGTVMDLLRRRLLDSRGVKILVLDEADNMLDQGGLTDQSIRVKGMLTRKDLQVVLFSATFPEAVVQFASRFAPNANEITLKHEDLTVEGIKQIYLDCNSEEDKFEVLVRFYGLLTIGSSIIFVKTRDTAARLEHRMTSEGHKVVSLSGGLDGATRDTIIDSFRMGHAKVLITTNVLARGIDVQSVSMVINYDVPTQPNATTKRFEPDPQTYLHRIGRTGRFGRVGVAVTFVSNHQDWQALMEIQKYFGTDIQKVATDDWDELEETVTRIIKSSRSGDNFKDGAAPMQI